ncbi:MAG: hypothetical protein AB8G05_19890 [Oligoflexales bacterium]
MYLLLITTIISLAFGIGCKTKKVNTPSTYIKPIEPEEPKEEKIISPISPLQPREEVLGENLQTQEAKFEEKETGKHKSLKILAEPDPDADYVQFAICQKENSKNCNPSVKNPLAFAAHMHTFPDPPEGELEVYIRSCVAPNRAVNYQRPCGNWLIEPYVQTYNYNGEIRKLLIDNYIASQHILKECHKIQEALEEYQSKNSKSQSQFDTLVANYLNHIPPETCKTLMLSQEWQALEEQIARESENIDSQKEKEGSTILLSLGVPAFIFGIVSYSTGVVYKNRFDKDVAKYWTHLIRTYAEETPRLKPYDSLKEINSRLTEVDAYIEAIERKSDADKVVYEKQLKSLETEQGFLKAYQEFAELNGLQILTKDDEKLKIKIEELAKNTNSEKMSIESKWVRQAEINKITEIDSRLNGGGLIKGIEPFAIKKPDLKPKKSFFSDLKYAGIISTAIGAILIGVEVFGLEVRTVSDIDTTKKKLDLIYEKINAIRSEIKDRQNQINNLTQN